jgi:hypothetical protein
MMMKRRLIRSAVALILMIISLIIGALLAFLIVGDTGRDFRPAACGMAILLLLVATALRGFLHWYAADLLLPLGVVEFLTLGGIQFFSGCLSLFDAFNLQWLVSMNLFIGLPWVIGLGLGTLIGRKTSRISDRNTVSDGT